MGFNPVLRSAVLHQRERSALGDLRVMMHPGTRGFHWNIGAEAGLGFQPVVAVVSVDRAALNVQMICVVADLVLGRLRRGRGRLY